MSNLVAELKSQIVLQGRSPALSYGADFCVTRCVTRLHKNGLIPDYVR
jgi:hypothetical protein